MMDENKCKARASGRRSFDSSRCSRKAGFGNGGLYCKQHAKQYPAEDQETTTMYAARQEYSGFDVAVCQVYDVTDKTLVIHSAQAIFSYAPGRGHTQMAPNGQWRFFTTARAALEWVHLRIVNKTNSLRGEIARIEQNLEPVERMLKLEDLESRVAEAVAERTTSIKRDLGHEG
jgi:hypothetical protein